MEQKPDNDERWWSSSHLMDYGAIAMLGCALIGVWAGLSPSKRFLVQGNPELSYPYSNETVPVWLLILLAVVLPVCSIVGALGFLRMRKLYSHRRFTHELHHAALALVSCVVVSQLITEVLKRSIGRYRPDYLTRPEAVLHEGELSWPSGHASLSFACLTFFSLWLVGKTRAMHTKHSAISLMILCSLPLCLALLIASSRIADYRHHPSDVEMGIFVGISVAFVCYLLLFNSLLSRKLCGLPRNRLAAAGFNKHVLVTEDTSLV